MPIAVACACGKRYSLKDELAGQQVKCPQCGATLTVAPPVRRPQADPAFDRDKFLLLQKRISLHAKYYVWDENNRIILFVERPMHWLRSLGAALGAVAVVIAWLVAGGILASLAADYSESLAVATMLVAIGAAVITAIFVAVWLSPKRHVSFYRDDTRAEPLLRVRQDNKPILINAYFTVMDAAGAPLARLRKNFLYNLIRRRWYCHSPDGQPLCLILEDSIILSLLRRVLGPMLGVLRTNFIILAGDGSGHRELGQFNRKFTLFDRYVLDMSGDPERTLDRRLAIAIGVMLDTGERR